MTFENIRDEVNCGNRVLLLVRHAERPRLDVNDKTFGQLVPITKNGEDMARLFGKKLCGITDDLQFRASPLKRTVMTAECIADGMGVVRAEVIADEKIGNGSAFIGDSEQVWRLYQDGKFFDKTLQYFHDGEQIGFNRLDQAADAFEEYLLDSFKSKLGIFASHDIYVAAFTYAKGVKTDWTAENWPRFMDAAAIVVEPDGTRRYDFLRAGLTEGVTGV